MCTLYTVRFVLYPTEVVEDSGEIGNCASEVASVIGTVCDLSLNAALPIVDISHDSLGQGEGMVHPATMDRLLVRVSDTVAEKVVAHKFVMVVKCVGSCDRPKCDAFARVGSFGKVANNAIFRCVHCSKSRAFTFRPSFKSHIKKCVAR